MACILIRRIVSPRLHQTSVERLTIPPHSSHGCASGPDAAQTHSLMGWLAQHFLQFLSGNIYTAGQLDKNSSRSVVGKLRLGVLNKSTPLREIDTHG
jgi:hypothetical protein